MTQGRRKLCIETIALFVVGAVFVGVGGFLCITAYRARRADAAAADAADRELGAPLAALSNALRPERRTDGVDFGDPSLAAYDYFTAVYDLSAHMVYLPDGERLEAHSGQGPLRDDSSHVDVRDLMSM